MELKGKLKKYISTLRFKLTCSATHIHTHMLEESDGKDSKAEIFIASLKTTLYLFVLPSPSTVNCYHTMLYRI